MDRTATVKEIARLADVSIGTVDRVLHQRSGVSSATRERVASVVAALGYKPNLLARQLSLNKTYLFRVIMPRADQDSGYWSLCRGGVRRAARDLASFGTQVKVDEFDRYDRAAYAKLLDEVMGEPGDGLLIAPVLPHELLQALDSLGGRVPYIFFDGDLKGASPLAVIGQDAYAGGYLAGRITSLLTEGRSGPVIALNAHAEDRHIGRRIEGFKDYFRDRGSASPWQVHEFSCFELERSEAADGFLEGLFRQMPDIAGFLVANSSGHAVGDWLRRSGRKAGVALVSWDLVPENVRSLREGSIDCLISQRPFVQGREGVVRLFRAVVERETGEAELRLPVSVYFKENVPRRMGGKGRVAEGLDAGGRGS